MLLWLGAPTIAALLKAPSLVLVLRVLACLQPIAGLGVIADSLLRRELRFRTIANVRIVSYGVGYGGVGIVAALAGAREWALVAANATQAILTTALLLRGRSHSQRLGVDWPAARNLLSFGGGFVPARPGHAVPHQVPEPRFVAAGARRGVPPGVAPVGVRGLRDRRRHHRPALGLGGSGLGRAPRSRSQRSPAGAPRHEASAVHLVGLACRARSRPLDRPPRPIGRIHHRAAVSG